MIKEKKDYFDFLFSVSITAFTILLFIGQITFIVIGLTIGIADWGIEGVVLIGVGAFGFVIAICLPLTLFWAWRFWKFDEKGITNGNLFCKVTILYSEIEQVKIDTIVIGAKPFITAQENFCFFKGKKVVTIPTFCLSKEETEWLKRQIKNINN